MGVHHNNHWVAATLDLVSQGEKGVDEVNMKDLFLLRNKIELHNLGTSGHLPHFLAYHNRPIRFQESLGV